MSTAMLACSRAGRRTILARHATRTLATDTLASSDSTSSAPPPVRRKTTMRTEEHPRRIRNSFSVYVRGWDDIDSMPTFFAMLRAVEKRFGRVRDFRLGRDYDVLTNYTNFFIADLATEEAYRRVPEKGTSIKVEIPVTSRSRPGGVGLDEIQELLASRDWDPEESGDGMYSTPIRPLATAEGAAERKMKTVEIIVRRSTTAQTEVRHRRRMRETFGFGVGFYKWAGFYEPPSVENGKPRHSPEMERALEKWAVFLEERGRIPGSGKPTRAGAIASDDADAADRASSIKDGFDLSTEALHDEVETAADVFAEEQASARTSDTPPSTSHPVPEAFQDGNASFLDYVIDSTTKAQPPSSSPPSPLEKQQSPARLSQREKILQRARQYAKTPLPEPPSPVAEAKRKAEEAVRAEEAKQATETLRERLMKLAGGKWL
ncbi:hypothetical protein BC628DRAFT_1367811 [Trametes gibbosa]|nr:hypothetical protein BC628DRAFT_1367811 [Trametes gibbosa]